MDIQLCLPLILAKFDLPRLTTLIAEITEPQWEIIYTDSMLLWPIYDTHNWSEEEYTQWVNQVDLPDTDLFPHEIRDLEEITEILFIIPSKHRVIFYDDLLTIQDEFTGLFGLKNYQAYDVDRKELMAIRLNDFLHKNRTINDIRNFLMAQVFYLENPNLYHKIDESNDIAEIKALLKEYDWFY